MKKPYSKVKEEFGKTLLNAGNFCLAATVFREISLDFRWGSATLGIAVTILLWLWGIALIHAATEDEGGHNGNV